MIDDSATWTRRVVVAALLASSLCFVLATRVTVAFEGRRIKFVKEAVPSVDGRVQVHTASDVRAQVLAAPVAIIGIIRNPGAAHAVFTITADGRAVCQVGVSAESTKRVDCVALEGWEPGLDHLIEVKGPSDDWALEFFELATHHGSSTRVIPFRILPKAATGFDRPGAIAVAIVWSLLFLLLAFVPVAPWRNEAVWAHRIGAFAVVVQLSAMVISPWVSAYLVVMPVGGFAVVVLWLMVRRVARLTEIVTAAVVPLVSNPRWRSAAAVALVAGVVAIGYGAVVREAVQHFNGNYSGLIHVSEAGFDRSPLFKDRQDVRDSLVLLPHEGYDGQFMYFALFDPLMSRFSENPALYRDVVDAPPYRFGRIGFSWLVRGVAGSRWNTYAFFMVMGVLAGVALSALMLALIARHYGASALWGLTVLAIPGFWQSIRSTLPEPVAAALLLAGCLALLKRRPALAAFALACSLLIRETGVVFVVALMALAPLPSPTWRSRAWLASAIAPMALWRVFVAYRLWPVYGWDGLLYGGNNLSVPFGGMIGVWGSLLRGNYFQTVPELVRSAIWFSLLLVLCAVVTVALLRHVERWVGVALGMYALMAVSLTYPVVWAHAANAERTSYEFFVLFALVSVGIGRLARPLRTAVGVCWCAAALHVLYGAHDALYTRSILFPWW